MDQPLISIKIKGNEKAIYQSNALAHPRTMVIKAFHTVVANRAMGAPGRPI